MDRDGLERNSSRPYIEQLKPLPINLSLEDILNAIATGDCKGCNFTEFLNTFSLKLGLNFLSPREACKLASYVDVSPDSTGSAIIEGREAGHAVIGYKPESWEHFVLARTWVTCGKCWTLTSSQGGCGQLLQIPIPVFPPSETDLRPIMVVTRCAFNYGATHKIVLPLMPVVSHALASRNQTSSMWRRFQKSMGI